MLQWEHMIKFDKAKWMKKYQTTEAYKNYQRNYKKNHRESINANGRRYEAQRRIENPEGYKAKYRRENLLRRYGITTEIYHSLHEGQNGRCAICGLAETALSSANGKPQSLAIDHCHDTNIVRGLLCFSCNRGIGYLKDNVLLLQNAIQYLSKV